MKKNRYLFLFVVLFSCSTEALKYHDFKQNTWKSEERVSFEFNFEDSSGQHDLELAVRHQTSYPYQNLILFAHHYFENKKLSTSAKASEREVIKLRRELQDAIKATKKANAGGNNNQVRYNRVVEENERLREKVKDLEATIKDEGDSQKVQKEKLAGECRRLERQRNELLTAFKKQMKLTR